MKRRAFVGDVPVGVLSGQIGSLTRVLAGVVVIFLALVVPPARAQPVDSPRLSPHEPEPRESDVAVVLTLSKQTPGRIVYRTVDGSCTDAYSGQQRSYCRPAARAPDDYGAVSGEVVFTGAGSKRIAIPIVDDDLAEGLEAFEVQAHEVEDTGGWAGASTAIVRITDDDGADAESDLDGQPAAATTTRGQPSGAAPVPTLPAVRSPVATVPATPTTAAPPSHGLEVSAASGELQPGFDFEPVSDGVPEPAAEPDRGSGGSGGAAPWLHVGLVGAGALLW